MFLLTTTLPFGQYSSPALFLATRIAARVLPACYFSTCDTPGISRHPHPEGGHCIILYQCVFFAAFARLSSAPVELFSRSRLRGTQGARLHTAQVWVPGGLRGTCSGRSKSQNLSGNHGVAFRELEPSKTMENPHIRNC